MIPNIYSTGHRRNGQSPKSQLAKKSPCQKKKTSILVILCSDMDKRQSTGWNLDRVFNSRSGCMCALHLCCSEAKRPNLKLKTRPKQLLSYLQLVLALQSSGWLFGKLTFWRWTITPSFILATFWFFIIYRLHYNYSSSFCIWLGHSVTKSFWLL